MLSPCIERILCPTDLQPASRASLEYALVLARRSHAALCLLHVVDPREAGDEARAAEVDSQLRALADLAWEGGVLATTVVRTGPVPATILHEAESLPADAVVMGAHGRGMLRTALLGSVAEEVVRKAPCPVLSVRHPAEGPGRNPEPAFTRVLCAVDFSEPSLAALDYAAWLAKTGGGDLLLVHALEWPVAFDGASAALATPRLDVEPRAALLARVPETMRDHTEVTIAYGGDAAEAIVRAAVDCGAGVIVMGVHGRGTLDRMVFGSTADLVLRTAPCPVFTLREVPVPRAPRPGQDQAAPAAPVR